MSTPQAEPLLERDGERHAIDALLDEGRGGHGAVLLVEGPPGIGKTALLGLTAVRAAERGMRVLHARGLPLEQTFAFGVARQLLEPPLRAAPAVERRRLLKGAAALAAPVLGTSTAPDEPVRRCACGTPCAGLAGGQPGRRATAVPARRRRALGGLAIAGVAAVAGQPRG